MKLIKNGTVMTMGPQGTLQADILIENGKIVDVRKITAEGAEIIDASGLLVCRLVDAQRSAADTKTGAQDQRSVNPVTAQLNAYDGVDPLSPQFASAWKPASPPADRPGSANDLRSGLRDQIRRVQSGRALRETAVRAEGRGRRQSEGRLRQTQSKSDDAHGDRGNDPRILPSGSGLPPEEAGSQGRSGQNAEIRSGAGKRRAGAR
ncbi:MAG: hypothetical protein ACLSFJ_07380 [Holdemania filiformis]